MGRTGVGPIARPRRLEQGEARQPLGVNGGEGQGDGGAAGVPDQVKPIPASRLRSSQDGSDLDVEGVAGRWSDCGVHLQVLGHRVDINTEFGEQVTKSSAGRRHDSRQQNDPPGTHTSSVQQPRLRRNPD